MGSPRYTLLFKHPLICRCFLLNQNKPQECTESFSFKKQGKRYLTTPFLDFKSVTILYYFYCNGFPQKTLWLFSEVQRILFQISYCKKLRLGLSRNPIYRYPPIYIPLHSEHLSGSWNRHKSEPHQRKVLRFVFLWNLNLFYAHPWLCLFWGLCWHSQGHARYSLSHYIAYA